MPGFWKSSRICVLCLAAFLPVVAAGQGTLGPAVYEDLDCFSMRAVLEDGHALAGDGKGPYVDGSDPTRVQAGLAMSIWAWRYTDSLSNKPNPTATAPKLRALSFDLDHPVEGGGGRRLGIVMDPIGRFHAAWKHEGTFIRTFTRTPVGHTVASDRVEMWVSTGGHQYVLQMGPWTMGLFSPRSKVAAQGTSQARITRESETEWTISAPPGSVARLSNYDDPDKPIDQGLYYFDFTVRVNSVEGAACMDVQ